MIKKVCYRAFMENGCFYIDDETQHGFLIDPGAKAETFLRYIRENGWTIESILLTHGHYDHIRSADILRQALDVPILAFEGADAYLKNERMNLSVQFGHPMTIRDAQMIKDGDTITLAVNPIFSMLAISTPGHTGDSGVFYSVRERIAFVGDTIFKGSIGTWEYPGGDREQLIRSVTERVLTLPDETVLYSGHTSETTVEKERKRYDV